MVTVAPLSDPPGSLLLIGRDVTEQNQATALLQQSEKLSSIGEIVAGVAHELNNPLSGVLGFSQLLIQKDVEGKFRHDIERIVDCAGHCQKIVQNLLSFARPGNPARKDADVAGAGVAHDREIADDADRIGRDPVGPRKGAERVGHPRLQWLVGREAGSRRTSVEPCVEDTGRRERRLTFFPTDNRD